MQTALFQASCTATCWKRLVFDHSFKDQRNRDENRHFIPLLYLSNEKLRFRSEIRVLFQMANIDMSSLPTIQSCMKELQNGNERLHVHLVDHNVLSPELDCFENAGAIS